jgi:hypothetical protein
MSADIGVIILSGALPLLGVLIGSGSTVLVQRGAARESRLRTEAEHTLALNEVARHEEQYPDWWGYVIPRKLALHAAIRKELRWQDDEAFIEPRLSAVRDEVLSQRGHSTAESQPGTPGPGLEQPHPGPEQPGP